MCVFVVEAHFVGFIALRRVVPTLSRLFRPHAMVPLKYHLQSIFLLAVAVQRRLQNVRDGSAGELHDALRLQHFLACLFAMDNLFALRENQ